MAAHKMKDGRWCVWLDLGSDPSSGKRLRKRVEARTKRDVDIKAPALRERHARGENVLDKPHTLTQLLDEWLATIEQQGKAANTIKGYGSAIKNHLAPRLGASIVPKLRAREVQQIFNDVWQRFWQRFGGGASSKRALDFDTLHVIIVNARYPASPITNT